ncbi:MAG: hypothetical protein QF676_01305, partial [Dehalococcoidia bacterium]|nr:hypothetical protein [Dehalococcoidia bacterium]
MQLINYKVFNHMLPRFLMGRVIALAAVAFLVFSPVAPVFANDPPPGGPPPGGPPPGGPPPGGHDPNA